MTPKYAIQECGICGSHTLCRNGMCGKCIYDLNGDWHTALVMKLSADILGEIRRQYQIEMPDTGDDPHDGYGWTIDDTSER